LWPAGRGQFRPQGHNLNNIGRGPFDEAIYQMGMLWALKFRTRSFLKIAFWKPIFWPCVLLMQPTGTVWTTLIGDQSGIISCEVWSKSNKWFQRRCCLKKLLTDDARTDDGRRTLGHHKSSIENFVLRWANNAQKWIMKCRTNEQVGD